MKDRDQHLIFEAYLAEQQPAAQQLTPPTLPQFKPTGAPATGAQQPQQQPQQPQPPQLPRQAGVTSSVQSAESINALTQQLKDMDFKFKGLQQQVEVIEDWMDEQGGQSMVAQRMAPQQTTPQQTGQAGYQQPAA